MLFREMGQPNPLRRFYRKLTSERAIVFAIDCGARVHRRKDLPAVRRLSRTGSVRLLAGEELWRPTEILGGGSVARTDRLGLGQRREPSSLPGVVTRLLAPRLRGLVGEPFRGPGAVLPGRRAGEA